MEPCTIKIRNRCQAGIQLAQKLKAHRLENTVIAAISKGGVVVAQPVSIMLHAPLEVVPCKRINYPTDESRTIGAVCPNNVMIYSHTRDLPQDYIQHQVYVLQTELRKEMAYYREDWDSIPIEGKNVVLVDDLIVTGNTMMACILEIRKRNPRSVVVATPFISAEAHFFLEEFATEIIYISMETQVTSPLDFYEEFSAVGQHEVKKLLNNARRYYVELC